MTRFLWIVLLALATLPAFAQSRTGPVRVIDGDTLAMAGERIRLHGINAPESSQRCDNGRWSCGQAATTAMNELVGGRPVTCVARDTDRYGRTVAVCRSERGVDLARAMVARGLATAYRRYSTDYVAEEAEARGAGRGMWAGQFEDPEAWRHRQADAPIPASPARRALTGFSRAMGELIQGIVAAEPTEVSGPLYGPLNGPSEPRARASGPQGDPMAPPAHDLAPAGMEGEAGLSAGQLCALMQQAGQSCR